MMTEANAHPAINRILIAVDASRRSLGVLETAAALAARRQLELVTLFIEDVSLINLAGLPFAREIDRISAVERRLDNLQMARALRTQAQQICRMLDRITSRLQLSYSFRVVRGSYLAEALTASTGGDVVFLSRVVGRCRGSSQALAGPGELSAMPFSPMRNAVWVLFDDLPGAARALALAGDLAYTENRELVVLLRSPAGEDPGRLRRRAAGIIGAEAVSVHYALIPRGGYADLCRILRRRECGMLVLHRDDPSHADQLATLLLEESECPVVLVH